MTFVALMADAVSGSPAYSAGTWRLADSGLFVSSGPLAVRSGALSVDSFAASLAGTTVSVAPGRAVVQGATTSTQGCYRTAMPTTWTQVLAAASSQDRIDLVYLRVWDNEVDSTGLTQADLVYLQGTPAGSPVAPTIPAGQAGFRICTVSVPHTGSPALTQTGVMPYTAAAGGIVPSYATGSPVSPETGQVRWRGDRAPTVQPGPLEIWDGAAWDAIVPDSYPRGSAATPTFTSFNGTPTTSTTEVRDTVLPVLQATLVSGRRYRVEVTGLVCSSTVANDLYQLKIRDSGSSSTPTSASTLIAQSTWECQTTGGPGQVSVQLSDTFIAGSSGVHTFSLFAQRIGGSGVLTPISGLPQRQLAIYDVGNV